MRSSYWKILRSTILILVLLSFARAVAQEPTPDPVKDVAFDQRLNEAVPLDLTFTDENGTSVRLEDYFNNRPVILLLAYYECPMLCDLALANITRVLRELRFNIGEQYEVVTLSIDPRETPEIAARKKAALLSEYQRPGAEQGWHFLTGRQAEIDRLAESIGFSYVYDPALDEYSHPTGLVLITPQGKISRYFFGFNYTAQDLRLGLVEASQERIGSLIDRAFLLCYSYNPATGKYTLLIQNVLRLVAVGTVLLLSGLILLMLWRERSRPGPLDITPGV
ncbi:MAG: SCO family protein [Chloroflexi bacterium]|nr:SCO family protein [Chloroflexota bacterium]